MKGKLLESETLRKQAGSNTKEQFAELPVRDPSKSASCGQRTSSSWIRSGFTRLTVTKQNTA